MRATRKPGAQRHKKSRRAPAAVTTAPSTLTATAETATPMTAPPTADSTSWTAAARAGGAEDQRLLARLAQRQRALSQVAGVLGQLQATSTAEQRASTEAQKEAEDATRRAERDATLRAAAEQKADRVWSAAEAQAIDIPNNNISTDVTAFDEANIITTNNFNSLFF